MFKILVFIILFYSAQAILEKNAVKFSNSFIKHLTSDSDKLLQDIKNHGCDLPSSEMAVTYKLSCSGKENCTSDVVEGKVPRLIRISLKCSEGYARPYNFQSKSTCSENGGWSPQIVPCRRTCKNLKPANMELSCSYEIRDVNCDEKLLVGTKVKPRCLPGYTEERTLVDLYCNGDGSWSSELPRCVESCGKLYSGSTPLTMEGSNTNFIDAPWHVAIYIKTNTSNDDQFDFLCSGTIISSLIVISASHCFYDEISNKRRIPQDYQIVVSKWTKSYTLYDNFYIKAYNINNIYFPGINLLGSRSSFDLNIALLETQEKIQFSPSVMPACLQWESSMFIPPISNGTPLKVNGWGFDGSTKLDEILQAVSLRYIYRDECVNKANEELKELAKTWLVNYLKADKLCAGDIKGPRVSPGNNGGGLLYQDKNNFTYYLLGIIGHKENLGTTSIIAFTNVLFYMEWIKKVKDEVTSRKENSMNANKSQTTTKKSSTTSISSTTSPSVDNRNTLTGCTIPPLNSYNLQYEISCPSDCKSAVSGSLVPHTSTLSFHCKEGYMQDLNQELEAVCIKNKWLPSIIPCKRKCRTLKPRLGVLLKCTYKEMNVNCTQNLRAGTVVFPQCLPQYRPEYSPDYNEIICQEDGEWSAALLRCIPICGRRLSSNPTPLIAGGENATIGEFPWHVAIYENTRSPPADLICGGTIISEYIIISAAHCFYDNSKETTKNASNYEIIVGKISRNRKLVDSKETQTYSIKNIFTSNFRGITFRFQNDIALVELESKITFGHSVLPACMYYSEDIIIPSKTQLLVAGWGLTENDTPSDLLKVVNLNYYSINECTNIVSQELRDFLSPQTFCVGSIEGSLQRGDSGGGLLYQNPYNSLYYLVGLVSFKPVYSSSIATITNIENFKTWIIKIRDIIQNRD